MTLLDRTEEELRSAESRRDSLEQQQVYLEAQLVQLKPNSTVFSDTGERIVSAADRAQAGAVAARFGAGAVRAGSSRRNTPHAGGRGPRENCRKRGLGRGAAGPPSSELNACAAGCKARRLHSCEARQRDSPEHPDRIRLEREVTDLQAQSLHRRRRLRRPWSTQPA